MALLKANPKMAEQAAKHKRGWHEKQRKDPVLRERYKAKCRLYMIRRSYGLSIDEYHAFFDSRGNKCEICGGAEGLGIDHDHVTGALRGLLCRDCNLMLGNAKDDVSRLLGAVQYLGRTQAKEERTA